MKNLFQGFFNDVRTFFWFLLRGPKFYPSLIEYSFRIFKENFDTHQHADLEKEWCKDKAISITDLFNNFNLEYKNLNAIENNYSEKIEEIISKSGNDFGGMGDINLIYNLCESIEAKNCIESGVAYGWSSEAILRSISTRNGKLVSVDMPMIGQKDYHLIGCAVSEKMKERWVLLREPDKNGLLKAIKLFTNKVDLIHYDSDKSYYGRKWSQPILYSAIRDGGFLISDDIDDNKAFREFVIGQNLNFHVVEFAGRYVGVIRKI